MKKKHIGFDVPWPNLSQVWAFARKWLLPNPGTLVLVIILALAVPAVAGQPQAPAATSTSTISYQGRLADAGGDPLTGMYNLEFRVYDVPDGGAPLWEELWTGGNSVQVSDGLFNVMLGSINTTLAADIEGHDELYLGITVGADSEMIPRVQLGSVPFSMRALTVPDGSITTDKIADGAVTSAKLDENLTVDGDLDVTGTAQASLFQSDAVTFVPNTFDFDYDYTLPQRGIFKVSIAVVATTGQCGGDSGTWSHAHRTYEAGRLGGYPQTVTLTPVTEIYTFNKNNGCTTSVNAEGLLDGAIRFNVVNANGATVYLTVTALVLY